MCVGHDVVMVVAVLWSEDYRVTSTGRDLEYIYSFPQESSRCAADKAYTGQLKGALKLELRT